MATTKTNEKANGKTNETGFAKLMESIAIPEASAKKGNGMNSIYKKEVYASICALDERGAKRLRKKLRDERDALIVEGLQRAKNLGEASFKEWVLYIWMPFASQTYKDMNVFFEEKSSSDPEKIKLLKSFAQLVKAVND